jgi:hypothetical protein
VSLEELFFPSSVHLSLQIVKSIQSQLTARMVRQVPNMPVYYDSVDLVNTFETEEGSSYGNEQCNFILFFIRNKIHFNLRSEYYVDKFLSECSTWSKTLFGNTVSDEFIVFLNTTKST